MIVKYIDFYIRSKLNLYRQCKPLKTKSNSNNLQNDFKHKTIITIINIGQLKVLLPILNISWCVLKLYTTL